MHILVTNDDGPPSPHSSPYVHCLIQQLQQAGHTVSVCLPHTQRSWIGKAHMIGQTLKPLYYRPSKVIHGEDSPGTTHHRPSPSGDVEEWILIDGTPASCVQIGLHHFFQDRGPIDLVVSGPNYGRNTTAVFALSSGTLGAALEAAVCQKKSIALSFAFFTRNHDPVIIEAACRRSVKVIETLYNQWPTDGSADLYSVNVPLVEGLENNKAIWTNVLQNYWREGGCFQEIEGEAGDENEEEERIREGVGGEVDDAARPSSRKGHTHKHFKWAPKFTDVYKSVEESGPGNDGWTVKEGLTRYVVYNEKIPSLTILASHLSRQTSCMVLENGTSRSSNCKCPRLNDMWWAEIGEKHSACILPRPPIDIFLLLIKGPRFRGKPNQARGGIEAKEPRDSSCHLLRRLLRTTTHSLRPQHTVPRRHIQCDH